jgi:hypothetical protein
MQHLTDDMWACTTHDGLPCSDAESDEDFHLDCSGSYSDSSVDYDGALNDDTDDSSTRSGGMGASASSVTDADGALTSNDEYKERWNGVWYATPHDYDLDKSDADDISEVGGSEDDSSSDMDESSGEGLDALLTEATANRLSSRDGRGGSFYGRACTGLSRVCSRVHLAGGAVHASS